jgi:glycosyltransferase involved in cell wall biosynthesis
MIPTIDETRLRTSPCGVAADGPEVGRVVVAISELGPGGAEQLVFHLVTGLRRRGIEVAVVTLEDEGVRGRRLRERGVGVHALRSRTSYDAGSVLRLGRLLRRLRPDVINVHDRWSLPYVRLASWPRLRFPLVFTGHGLMYGEPERGGMKVRLAARGLGAVTAVSEEVGRRHAAYLGWGGEVRVIPNAVPDRPPDPARRRRTREALGLSEDTCAFLAVGNARPEKAFDDLLRAAAELQDRSALPPWEVLVAGGMPGSDYCTRLRADHARLGLEDTVRFLGFRDDVPALYDAADAFVLSSRSEGLPMVVLEAMMAGLPVVATRVGGVPGAIGTHGLLVEPDRPAELADAMARLLCDRQEASALGAGAREKARRKYSLDAMVSGYLGVYKQAVEAVRARKGGARL